MSHTYTTNQIKLNVPAKVLSATVNTIAGTDYWPFANSPTDPWYQDAPTARYYRWRITMSVTEVIHGSNLTRDDFRYNGLDVRVNDWIASSTSGQALKIVNIEAKTKNSVTCIVEDWLRYNTFKSSTGNGIFTTGAAVVFTLNENGMPMLDPLPTSVSLSFYPVLTSRFSYLNPQENFVLEQDNHGLSRGDVVSVTSNGFVKSNAATAVNVVGVVTEAGPGDNYFMISPNNKIIDLDPPLPGVQGERVYVNDTGDLSNVIGTSGKAVFLNLTGPTPTKLVGTVSDPTVNVGHTVAVNGIDITFSGFAAQATLDEMIVNFNDESANTLVTATKQAAPTIVSSSSVGTAYGLVGGYPPFAAEINGTTVNFTSNGSVYPGISTPEDMAFDINAASIPNLEATATETVLTLTETSGGSIIINNVSPDANANPFVGTSNISGLPATTTGLNQEVLVLNRYDGGEILIFENVETFQIATGIFSGQNGALPLGMNIEQGIRVGGTTVVADIAERDGLTAQVGDQAYVLDGGLGEWVLFLYNGSGWTQIATQDSSTVDARTLTTTFSGPFSGGNVSVQNIGTVSPGRKITTVSVEVEDPLVGYTSDPFIEIGTAANVDIFMAASDSDLTVLDEFIVLPEEVYSQSATSELLVQAKLTHFTASQGNVTVKITFL